MEQQHYLFKVGDERHIGYITGPRCGSFVYIQPVDWPEQEFPHLVPQEDILTVIHWEN